MNRHFYGLCLISVALSAGALADEPTPRTASNRALKESFSANPNRNVGLASDHAAAPEAPKCGLSPTEEVLVNGLRKRLAELDRREAEIAAREAALREVLGQLRLESARLAGMRAAVDTAVEKKDLRTQGTCDQLVAIERTRDAERVRREAEAAAEARRIAEAAAAERRTAVALTEVQKREAERNEIAAEAAKAREVAESDAKAKAARQAAAVGASNNRKAAEMATHDEESAARSGRIAQLAGIVKKMRPAEAAKLLGDQDEDVSLSVLEALGNRNAAKVLAAMAPARSKALAKALVSGVAP